MLACQLEDQIALHRLDATHRGGLKRHVEGATELLAKLETLGVSQPRRAEYAGVLSRLGAEFQINTTNQQPRSMQSPPSTPPRAIAAQ